VSLKFYVLIGREVAVLADEVQSPGSKTVRWNASGMPNGVYFCRLTTIEGVLTKAMLLLK